MELNAVDLHLLDRSIDSSRIGDYVKVVSPPHNFYETLLCTRMTFDILKPQNDTVVLGGVYSGFTAMSAKAASEVAKVKTSIKNLGTSGGGGASSGGMLDSLIARSFGVFRTEQVSENGSTVYYLHDKMTIEESTNIWRMAAGVFSVSSDGGQTWSAGIDADGNAVLNMLSVIGIDTKWLRAGNLTDISSKLGGWLIDAEGIHGTNSKYYVDVYCPTNTEWNEGGSSVIEYGRFYGGVKEPKFRTTGAGQVYVTEDGREVHIYRDGIMLREGGQYRGEFTITNNVNLPYRSTMYCQNVSFLYAHGEWIDSSAMWKRDISLKDASGNTVTLTICNGIITKIV